MLLSLPVIAFVVLVAALRRRGLEWRDGVIGAAAICGGYVVVVCELLSLPRWLSKGPIAVAWGVLVIAAVAALRYGTAVPAPPTERAERPERLLLAGVGVLACLAAIAAAVAAPNVWDAMMYHLPRVVRWLDEGSVAFYPANDVMQLTMPPWHEYAMLQAQALWGSDQFVAVVSVLCFLGTLVAVSKIAGELGASLRGQVIAAVVCATLPEGILCASSPKNEWALTFWLAVVTLTALQWRDRPDLRHALMAGAALGLAILTKATAYVYAPFLLLAGAVRWRHAAWRQLLIWAPAVLGICLVLDLPQAVRNYHTFGSALGISSQVGDTKAEGDDRFDFAVPRITARGVAAGILRGVALQVGTPSAPINQRSTALLSSMMRAIGEDPDNPDAMARGKSTHILFPFQVNKLFAHEIWAGNPWHALLLLLAVGALLVRPRRVDALSLAGALACGFIAVSAYIRWQPFQARLHLPLLAIGSALTALWIERWPRAAGRTLAWLLLLLAVPFAVRNDLRPMLDAPPGRTSGYSTVSIFRETRERGYFNDLHKDVAADWIAAANAVAATGCRDVAVDAEDYYTYPIFALLGAGVERHLRFIHVINRTEALQDSVRPAPCAVVCLDCKTDRRRLSANARAGEPSRFGDLVVFLPAHP